MAATVAFTLGAAAGTSPPAIAGNGLCDDDRGTLTFGTGTSPTTGTLLTVTLGGNYSSGVDGSSALVVPSVAALNAATAALGLFVSSWTQRTVVIGCTVAPAASQANTVYSLSYRT